MLTRQAMSQHSERFELALRHISIKLWLNDNILH